MKRHTPSNAYIDICVCVHRYAARRVYGSTEYWQSGATTDINRNIPATGGVVCEVGEKVQVGIGILLAGLEPRTTELREVRHACSLV